MSSYFYTEPKKLHIPPNRRIRVTEAKCSSKLPHFYLNRSCARGHTYSGASYQIKRKLALNVCQTEAVAPIQIYFGGDLSLTGRGTKLWPKPEAQRTDSGSGVLGESGSEPPPTS